ncbi:Phosphoserine aminotransferase 2, chloroplastic [Sesamum angolense]|uniref:phosphoserine transaminase n=1 Tax=Sesamum angolense TaxID=2727404 RepID=A0AAE2C655_9LAMI|nr:Phosphoserine aminotransferase 2, chloroplastic [Sesamum angolense]
MTTVAMSSAAADTAFRHQSSCLHQHHCPSGGLPLKPLPSVQQRCPQGSFHHLLIHQTPSAATAASSSPDRVFNFAAGPATLPENVLLKAQSELYNWNGCGMSGGATTQFAAVPLNLCSPDDVVDYVVTGSWGDKAFKEAAKYCKPKTIWSGKSEKYTKIPTFDALEQTPGAKYLHICANETIHGVEFKDYPKPAGESTLLIADMSSNFCSKPVDVTKFGVIYAGAQKNVGPSGVTIVIIRSDLIGNAQPITPVMLDYKIHADNNSLYNTPPCYGIYMCGLVFEDLIAQGGLSEVEKKNVKKGGILYDAIDGSKGFYRCPVEKSVRSLMNVPFTLAKPELEAEFIKEAAKEKMVQLKGTDRLAA